GQCGQEVRVIKETLVVEWYLVQTRSRQLASRNPVHEGTEIAEAEKGWIEPKVFKNVVVHPVISDSSATTHYELLIPESIPCESEARSKVVAVLVPDFGVPYL